MSQDGTAEDVASRVRDAANRIQEPCGMAQGLAIGMVDMGLIREIDVQRCEKHWNVTVRARVTSPDCLHVVYFERELRAAVATIAGIGQFRMEWDGGYDWTPECMSEALRVRMKERRAHLIRATRNMP
jgi:metal-sulfur cluster biosynthetic enzyme